MKINKGKGLLMTMVLMFTVVLLSGCFNNTADYQSDRSNKIKAVDKSSSVLLSESNTLTVSEQLISLNKYYKVYSDNGEEFKVNGKFNTIMGDELKLKDSDENIIATDKQIKRYGVKMNRMAEISNSDGVIGYIGEEFMDNFKLSIDKGNWYHFYDQDGNEIGKANSKFNFSLGYWEIKDLEGNKVYTISKQFSINNKLKITVIDDSKIPIESAIFYTIIINELSKKEDE